MSVPRQLVLSLELAPSFGEEDFLVAPSNARAYAMVLGWPEWPDRGMLLVGPQGAGKSHISAIWQARAQAVVLGGQGLAEADLDALASGTAVVVDGADDPALDEQALFHLMNLMRERRLWLLLTASRAPGEGWPLLPDLASRLRQLPRAELDLPDDELVRAVLVKLFVDRQLVVDAGVIDFVARRIERSLDAARQVVAAIDAEGLALGRRVTKPIAAAVLARFGEGEDQ